MWWCYSCEAGCLCGAVPHVVQQLTAGALQLGNPSPDTCLISTSLGLLLLWLCEQAEVGRRPRESLLGGVAGATAR